MEHRDRLFIASLACLLALWLGLGTGAQAQTDTAGFSVFAGAGGSTSFGNLYNRARFGGNGLFGISVRFAPGNAQAFELAGIAEGAYFFNDGEIGGDLMIANGGAEFRLVAGLRQPVHYFFGVGSGFSRVREKLFRDRETGQMTDGYIEWGPYFAPSVGFDVPVSKKLRLFGIFRYMSVFGNRINSYQYLSFFTGIRL